MNFENPTLQWQWITIDPNLPDSCIPCIYRNDDKYVLIPTIKESILNNYENQSSVETNLFEPLVTTDCTEIELNLLNDININHALNKYGTRLFNYEDKLVRLDHFVEHYAIIKKLYRLINAPVIVNQQPVSLDKPTMSQLNNQIEISTTKILSNNFEQSLLNNSYLSLIQVNDFILVLIEFSDFFYQFNRVSPKSHQYVLLEDLAQTGLVERESLKRIAKTIKATQQLINLKNWLSINFDINSNLCEGQTIEIVNVQEAQLMCLNCPVYFKKLSKDLKLTKNYKHFFNMSGGMMKFKEKIVPFYRLNSDFLLISSDVDNFEESEEIKLNIENKFFQVDFEFFQLLQFYYSSVMDDKVPSYFVNVKKYLNLCPKKYQIICEFNSAFPTAWVNDLNKYADNIASEYDSVSLSPISQQEETVKTSEYEEELGFTTEEVSCAKLLRSFSDSCLCVPKFNTCFRSQTKKASRRVKMRSSLSISQKEEQNEMTKPMANSRVKKRLERLFRKKIPVKIKQEKRAVYRILPGFDEFKKKLLQTKPKKVNIKWQMDRVRSRIEKILDEDFVVSDDEIIKLSPNETFNFSIKKVEAKNLQSIKKKSDLYSSDDFDMEFYLKKFKIKPCQVKVDRVNLKKFKKLKGLNRFKIKKSKKVKRV